MYKKNNQMKFTDYVFPYGTLDSENDWVKLADLIPWFEIEEKYAKKFVNNGHPAHSVRIALGSLIVRQRLSCSDAWTVKHVSENPYIQYFLGMKEYTNSCPFGESTMVEFRKRFGESDIKEIFEMTIPKPNKKDKNEPPGDDGQTNNENSEEKEQPNGGTLLMDATCVPADIAYPQDINLLNEAREKLEGMIDELCAAEKRSKPRTYPQQARRDYLKCSKNKKTRGKANADSDKEAASIHRPGHGIHKHMA